jgi:hypothetical protein
VVMFIQVFSMCFTGMKPMWHVWWSDVHRGVTMCFTELQPMSWYGVYLGVFNVFYWVASHVVIWCLSGCFLCVLLVGDLMFIHVFSICVLLGCNLCGDLMFSQVLLCVSLGCNPCGDLMFIQVFSMCFLLNWSCEQIDQSQFRNFWN